MSIETEITRIKTNIANAYTKAEEKGATLPEVQNSDNLASTIDSIDTKEWKPQYDWWDIKKILEEDTEDYPAKMIVLLSNDYETINLTLNNTNKVAKIKTSDGEVYTSTSTHTWNNDYDKESELGYKTRYYIIYFTDTDVYLKEDELLPRNESLLYFICKNLNISSTNSYNSILRICYCLQSFDFINSYFVNEDISKYFMDCWSLQKIPKNAFLNKINSLSQTFFGCVSLCELPNISPSNPMKNLNFDYTFYNCRNLKNIDLEIPSEIKNFYKTFLYSSSINYIKKIDFLNVENVDSTFNNCSSLKSIGEITNIKISGLNFSASSLLNHDTLIRILNALYDYSDSGNTYTLTLGSTNLAKLTDEEIAIGTNKGWTIS